LKRKLAGLRGKLTVVKRQIAEIQAQEKPTAGNPGLFGQHSPSHPGLRALQDRRRQLERAVEQLEEELWRN
jgi:polyhydroxyalkanoate synthesis regulator phasin